MIANPFMLEPRLRAISAQKYRRFSDAEYARRNKLLEENMTVVVQPNVTTAVTTLNDDQSKHAGVQVGELIRITKTGFEKLHRKPRGAGVAGTLR
jgi:Xaa-Pro aminopeptidase